MFLNDILEEFIYPLYSQFIMKYTDYTTDYTTEYEKNINRKKTEIKESFKKTMSYVFLFILLYLFKDFIFLLISKFDKLLRNSI